MYVFDNEWGHHEHTVLTEPPYEFKKPITCEACINWLNAKADVWQRKFAIREGHNPDTFWIGYKRIWDE